MRTHTRLVLINLIGVVFILGGAGVLVTQCVRFEHKWSDLRDGVQSKADAMEQIHGAIGFGGMIHAFKNFVLRREDQYLIAFEIQTRLAREGLESYRANPGVTSQELSDLDIIEQTINRYTVAMERARGSAETVVDLDSAVRIDDTPCLDAIERLTYGQSAQRAEIMDSVDQGLSSAILNGAWAGLLGSVLVLGVGGVLAYRVGTRLERSAEERNEVLEQRTHFLANMSHEIRTPLNALLGFAQLARDPWVSQEEREEYLERIRCNGVHLMDLIDNILDMSKIEAGQIGVALSPTNVRCLVHEVLSIVGVNAHEKGIALREVVDEDVPEAVMLDPMRVRQILINLVGNAIKFTESGSVTVHASFTPIRDGQGDLRIAVVDTGEGIEPLDQSRIFEVFTQADPTTTRRFGGTGLGLNISRRLAQILGGEISLESKLGKGSVFTLRTPTTVCELKREQMREVVSNIPDNGRDVIQGLDVLLVEDGPDNQVLIRNFLELGGANVVTVGDGQEAIDAVRHGGVYDIILMDMQMPNVDGYEATRRLRASGYDGPIIALTAHAMSEDREKCLRCGCDDYLSKPIGRKPLIGKCLEHARAGSRARSA